MKGFLMFVVGSVIGITLALAVMCGVFLWVAAIVCATYNGLAPGEWIHPTYPQWAGILFVVGLVIRLLK